MQAEDALNDKQQTIVKMKKQVEKLDEEADLAEAFGDSPEAAEKLGGGMPKRKKTKMCPTLREKGLCTANKDGKCQFAHNPIELDLIKPDVKMKNLNSVI